MKAEHKRGTGKIQLDVLGTHASLDEARRAIDEYSKAYCEANSGTCSLELVRCEDNSTSVELHDAFDNWVKLMVFDTSVDPSSERAKLFWQGERNLLATHELEGGDELFFKTE